MAVDGRYAVTVEAMGKSVDGELEFITERKHLGGTVSIIGQRLPIEDGKTDGRNVSGKVKADTPAGHIKLTVHGQVDGDEVSGKIKALVGKATFSGKRI